MHSREVKCNLFKRGNRQLINGNVNILKKAVPNVFAEGWEGLVLSPISICYKGTNIQELTSLT